MAMVGSQKLYNVARESNGPMLQFMLMCPENLSPYKEDKLRNAILQGPRVDECLTYAGKVDGATGDWARSVLESRCMTPAGEWVAHTDKLLALYEGEWYGKYTQNDSSIITAFYETKDPARFERLVPIIANGAHVYDLSSEDDFFSNVWGAAVNRGWVDKREIDHSFIPSCLRQIIDFGTHQRGFTSIYQRLPGNMVQWQQLEVLAYMYEERGDADLLDGTQRAVYNAVSDAVRARFNNPNFTPSVEE